MSRRVDVPIQDDMAEDRYAVPCGECGSMTWFDTDEELPFICPCWRCGTIINGDL